MKNNIKILLLATMAFVSCEKEEEIVIVPEIPITAGEANFAKYVAVGNSLTAGFSDGALFIEGQKNSWTNILNEQFKLVEGVKKGTEFKIPFMTDNLGGFSTSGFQIPQTPTRRYWTGCSPSNVSGLSGTVLGVSIAANGPYNNCGIPGAKCIDLVKPGYAGLSPYFARIATAPAQTVLDYAKDRSATFFSLWIGNNDVLSYALEGGDTVLAQITPSAGVVGVGFDASYQKIIDDLTANGANGVVANIPYVSTIPMFTTITTKPVLPSAYFEDAGENGCGPYATSATDLALINQVNGSLLGPLKAILESIPGGAGTGRIELLSTTTSNALLIKDESLVNLGAAISAAASQVGNPPQLIALAPFLGGFYGQVRMTKTGDLIPLTTRGVIGTNATIPPGVPPTLGKYGITFPLEDKHILIPSEILELKNATDAFNTVIAGAATTKNLAFVDTNKLLQSVAKGGISSNGYTVTSTYPTGGGFSLDGVHPCPRGYALIANEFIKVINEKYKSTLKPVDISKYRVQYPRTF